MSNNRDWTSAMETVMTPAICPGCYFAGSDLVDSQFLFDRAIMRMPDGESVEIKLKEDAK